MADTTNKENKKGKKVLQGVIILLWVAGALTWLGLLSSRFFEVVPCHFFKFCLTEKPAFSSGLLSLAIPSIYVASLVGLYIRKGWAVPVTRAAIVVTMVIFFPIGTIFGAIVWKRINDPIAKKYLNYGSESGDNEEDDVEITKKEEDNNSKPL